MTDQEIAYVGKCIKEDMHRFYTWYKWEHLRKRVLEMDKYECQDCKATGAYTKATTVHHNQYVKKHPEQALEIWYTFQGKRYRNLVSLCHFHHEMRHKRGKFKEQPEPLTEERW